MAGLHMFLSDNYKNRYVKYCEKKKIYEETLKIYNEKNEKKSNEKCICISDAYRLKEEIDMEERLLANERISLYTFEQKIDNYRKIVNHEIANSPTFVDVKWFEKASEIFEISIYIGKKYYKKYLKSVKNTIRYMTAYDLYKIFKDTDIKVDYTDHIEPLFDTKNKFYKDALLQELNFNTVGIKRLTERRPDLLLYKNDIIRSANCLDIIVKNMHKLPMHEIFLNPYYHKIFNEIFDTIKNNANLGMCISKNSNMVPYLKKNMNLICWNTIGLNSGAYDIIIDNLDKIESIKELSKNKNKKILNLLRDDSKLWKVNPELKNKCSNDITEIVYNSHTYYVNLPFLSENNSSLAFNLLKIKVNEVVNNYHVYGTIEDELCRIFEGNQYMFNQKLVKFLYGEVGSPNYTIWYTIYYAKTEELQDLYNRGVSVNYLKRNGNSTELIYAHRDTGNWRRISEKVDLSKILELDPSLLDVREFYENLAQNTNNITTLYREINRLRLFRHPFIHLE